jgi:hypothetical protein
MIIRPFPDRMEASPLSAYGLTGATLPWGPRGFQQYISTWDLYLKGAVQAMQESAVTEIPWRSANGAVYAPIFIPEPTPVDAFAISNGPTVSGNVDVGLFDLDAAGKPGAAVLRDGGSAQAGTNDYQFLTFTERVVWGYYYLGLSIDNTTGRIHTYTSNSSFDFTRIASNGYLQASAYPLPSSATPTGDASHNNGGSGTVNEHIPWIGLRIA